MHLFKTLLIVSIVLNVFFIHAASNNSSYPETGVQIHVKGNKQEDSIGFNLITEFNRVVFPEIFNGHVTLWKSVQKEAKVSKTELNKLFTKLHLPYLNVDDYFFYEKWTLQNGKFKFSIQGYTIYYFDPLGSSHNLGYVDLKEIEKLIKSKWIRSNPNGSILVSLWQALYSKKYRFDIIQFGNKIVKNDINIKSKIFADAFLDPKIINESKINLPEQKSIKYSIINTNWVGFEENKRFFNRIENYLIHNKAEILNRSEQAKNTAIEKVHHLQYKVDRAEVYEVITKQNGEIYSSVKQITFFINKEAIAFHGLDLAFFDLTINFIPFEEYLSKKPFVITLDEINNNKISILESSNYLNKIKNLHWNKITYDQSISN